MYKRKTNLNCFTDKTYSPKYCSAVQGSHGAYSNKCGNSKQAVYSKALSLFSPLTISYRGVKLNCKIPINQEYRRIISRFQK